MKRQEDIINLRLLILSTLMFFMLTGCVQLAESCPVFTPVDLSEADVFVRDDNLPFQFPLDDSRIFTSVTPFSTHFASYGMTTRGPEYHAAEDILQPAGTPVYAIAGGRVSFSGPMDGYGWLVIIDHPQVNLYSLYGHLSPSRWQIEPGSVAKGELIGYLGEPYENGGSTKHPLRPHLHLGVRAGQRANYPGMGQWRWQAGWIRPCPQNLGWLQPSVIISGQDIPIGGFPEPTTGFVAKWWIDLLFTGIYLSGGVSMLIYAKKQNKPTLLVISSVVLFAAGLIFYTKGTIMSYVLFTMAVLFVGIGIYRLILRSIKSHRA